MVGVAISASFMPPLTNAGLNLVLGMYHAFGPSPKDGVGKGEGLHIVFYSMLLVCALSLYWFCDVTWIRYVLCKEDYSSCLTWYFSVAFFNCSLPSILLSLCLYVCWCLPLNPLNLYVSREANVCMDMFLERRFNSAIER